MDSVGRRLGAADQSVSPDPVERRSRDADQIPISAAIRLAAQARVDSDFSCDYSCRPTGSGGLLTRVVGLSRVRILRARDASIGDGVEPVRGDRVRVVESSAAFVGGDGHGRDPAPRVRASGSGVPAFGAKSAVGTLNDFGESSYRSRWWQECSANPYARHIVHRLLTEYVASEPVDFSVSNIRLEFCSLCLESPW